MTIIGFCTVLYLSTYFDSVSVKRMRVMDIVADVKIRHKMGYLNDSTICAPRQRPKEVF